MCFRTEELQKVNEMIKCSLIVAAFSNIVNVLGDYRDHLPDEPDPGCLSFPLGRAEKSGHCASGLFSLLVRYISLEPGDTAVSIYFTLGGQAVSTLTTLQAYLGNVPAVGFGCFPLPQQTTF